MKHVWLLIVSTLLVLAPLTPAPARGNPEVDDLQRLASQGEPDAMIELGQAYYNGTGVLKDPFRAKCWVQQARQAGLESGDDAAARRAEGVWNRLELWRYSGDCPPPPPAPAGPRAGESFVEPVTGMVFVRIQGRCFSPGTGKKKGASQGARVCPESFWMAAHEVTQGQWRRVMGSNPSRFRGEDLPVEQVTWEEAQTFVRKLNRLSGQRLSLPTEIQWEFACSGGGRHPFPWGREISRPQANCGGCDAAGFRGRPAPTGSFPPNALGLYDMGGNVREWCRDGKGHGRSKDRPVRGGSFVGGAGQSRCGEADRLIPGMKAYYLGFRLAAETLN